MIDLGGILSWLRSTSSKVDPKTMVTPSVSSSSRLAQVDAQVTLYLNVGGTSTVVLIHPFMTPDEVRQALFSALDVSPASGLDISLKTPSGEPLLINSRIAANSFETPYTVELGNIASYLTKRKLTNELKT